MPESVTDRPTSAYEHVFLLTKSGKPTCWKHSETKLWVNWPDTKPAPDYRWKHRETGEIRDTEQPADEWRRYDCWRSFDYWYDADAIAEPAGDYSTIKMPDGWDTGAGAHGSYHRNGREKGKGGVNAFRGQGAHRTGENGPANRDGRDMRDIGAGNIRNARNVWTIATKPYKEAHFATFPPELPRRCILAGCPAGGVVLDPFFGSGTVGEVAETMGRQWTGIELNPEYVDMARKRTAQRGLFQMAVG
jgi:hypothetical protein